MEQAVSSHRQGDHGRAIACCELALRERPDEPEALHLAAMVQASGGDTRAALALAQRAARASPENPRYLLTLGRLLQAEGEAAGARDQFTRVLQLDGAAWQAYEGLASAYRSLDDNDSALATLAEGAQLTGQPRLLRLYGHALAAAGDPQGAERQFEKSLAKDPSPAALMNLGLLRLQTGKVQEAISAFEDLHREFPDDPQALRHLALALQSAGDFTVALQVLDKLENMQPLAPDDLARRGSLLLSLGNRIAARAALDDALRAQPDNPQALASKAELLEREGHYEDGLALLQPGLQDARCAVIVQLAAARLMRRLGRPEQARELLHPRLDDAALEAALKRRLLFTYADLCDDCGDYDDAFRYYTLAHGVLRKSFDMAAHREWISRAVGFFTASTVAAVPRASSRPPRVAFIVGMPRSGTSLVEQILASHPQVQAGGERPDIGRLAQVYLPKIMRPGAEPPKPDELGEHAGAYLAASGELATGVKLLTDKMPLNFLYLGIVHMVFPDALVIHCRREARDNALSCYFTDFTDPALAFTEDLQQLAAYQAEYERLMDHWSDVLPLRMHTINYEELVAKQEPVTRALLDFAGLPWDERCLSFHEHERIVDTASHAQVRRPIYASSVGRSRNYEKHLGPLQESGQQ